MSWGLRTKIVIQLQEVHRTQPPTAASVGRVTVHGKAARSCQFPERRLPLRGPGTETQSEQRARSVLSLGDDADEGLSHWTSAIMRREKTNVEDFITADVQNGTERGPRQHRTGPCPGPPVSGSSREVPGQLVGSVLGAELWPE